MSRIKIIPALLLLAIMGGCRKNDTTVDVDGGDTATAISLGTTASWATKGASVDELADVAELAIYSFDAYNAGSWAALTSSEYLEPFFTTTTTSMKLTTSDEGETWDYAEAIGGLRYWRADCAESVTLFALYPESEITTTFDEESGKPKFSYTMLGLANENDDLVVDALYDLNDSKVTDGKVEFSLQHALTKISLEVKTSGTVPDNDKLSYYDEATGTYADEYFFVNDITFSGLYNEATLDIALNGDGDGSTRSISWTLDEDKTIEVTAAQDNTILPIYIDSDEDTPLFDSIINPSAKLTSEYESVMEEGQAIFMLPQLLGESRDAAPTAKVYIRRLYYTKNELTQDSDGNVIIYHEYLDENGATVQGEGVVGNSVVTTGDVTYYFKPTSVPSGEVIYVSDAMTIPPATSSSGWTQGEHNILQFTFYVDDLSSYTIPMTLTSTIYDWTETTVDVQVNQNTYMYASANYFEVGADEDYADMIICTNYEYDLRRHCRKYELDGTSTESAGFTYYTVDNTASNQNSWTEEMRLEPVLLWNDSDFSAGKDYTYDGLSKYPYSYDANGTLYVGGTTDADGVYQSGGVEVPIDSDGYMDPTIFQDSEGWMYFAIVPYATDSSKDFYYKVKRTTREEEGLYTNTSVGDDYSYGINKYADDAVYTLRLNINEAHLDTSAGDGYGYFFGKIGAEAISNGGGLVTTKFRVTLKQTINN